MSTKFLGHRIRVMTFVILGLLMIVILRLIQVQAIAADSYRNKANAELNVASTILAPRGTITDANGVELARSVATYQVVVDQTQISHPAQAASLAAPYLNLKADKLILNLTGKSRYKIIAKNITPQGWQNLQNAISTYNHSLGKSATALANQINGFYGERGYSRVYPEGSLASSLIGIVNSEGIGSSGLESSMNTKLAGINGKYFFQDGAGTIIPGSQDIIEEPRAGNSIRLTINRDIQWVAQNAISLAVKNAHAKSGTVIVMNPHTGEILAEASAPSFDPSKPKTITVASLQNTAVQDVYEPGSTGKVITVAAALETKATTPLEVFDIPSQYKIDGTVYHDAETHGDEKLTTTGILAASSNIGAIQIGAKLPNQTLYNFLHNFGIGQVTNSGLPGESGGLLHPVNNWYKSTSHTVAFGQGYSVTSMQAIQVFSTIANDGVRVPPHIVAGSYGNDGVFFPASNPTSIKVISSKTANTLRKMMESVVSPNGTAPAAAIPGFRVAGKTGTAQRYDDTCGCYRGYTSSFIGFAPADKPEYVVSVVIQDPKGVHFGGLISAPVFKQVMSFVLQTQNVSPTPGKAPFIPLNSADLAKFKSNNKSLKTLLVAKPTVPNLTLGNGI